MVGTRIYVGGLSYRVGERDLERFFRGYGKLRDIVLKNGFAFVEFDDYRDADDAVYEMNGKELMGERVLVEFARGTRATGNHNYPPATYGRKVRAPWMDKYGLPSRTDYRLIVENLSSRVSWQDLKDFMRQAGDVTYADAHKHRRNEGVVEFATYGDMKTALSRLDGKDLHGRHIRLINDSASRRHKSHSRSSSKSRSRSRSRSLTRSRSHSRSNSRSRSRSQTRSHSKSRSRSRSHSQTNKSRSNSRSPSRSSATEEQQNPVIDSTPNLKQEGEEQD